MKILSVLKSLVQGAPSCTPEELRQMLQGGAPFLLLDVRRDEELAKARIEGAVHIPLDELERRISELGQWRQSDVVVMCHHGIRSNMAAQALRGHGFERVRNLSGGIHAYAGVDPTIGLY